jgi:hypothetical protein
MPAGIEGSNMDGDAAIRDIRALRRIAATLVALATLAELASGRSFPVRWLVLAILRPAEAVAAQFVAEMTYAALPARRENPACRNGPGDALLLAWRFRTLAAALAALLGLASLPEHWNTGLAGFVLVVFRPGPRPVTAACPGPNDTS